jgi:tellurite resistance protein TerC
VGLLQAAALGMHWPVVSLEAFWQSVRSLSQNVWLGTPIWMWAGFLGIILALLLLDLFVVHRKPHAIGVWESLAMAIFYGGVGVAFGGWIWFHPELGLGHDKAMDYWNGFAVEQSLSMDNVFVIALILGSLAIPRRYQHRVLFWGVLGVIVLRGLMISLGAGLVEHFHWVLYLFGLFLVASGFKLLFSRTGESPGGNNVLVRFVRRRFRVTDELHGEDFFVRESDGNGRPGKKVLHATPLFLALLCVELADVAFALDSVPAVFAITTDPFVVFTSNIFAILGLRSLFFALSALLDRFAYLKYALSALLVLIGGKVLVLDVLKWRGVLPPDATVPPALSLGVTLGILAAGFIFSVWKTRPKGAAKGAEREATGSAK